MTAPTGPTAELRRDYGRVLRRKLGRDLLHLRTPLLAVALVLMIAAAFLFASLATRRALQGAVDRFYKESAFADLTVVSLAALPNADVVRAVPGVALAEASIELPVRLRLPRGESAGVVRSLQRNGNELNRLRLESGRQPRPASRDEVVLGVAFARAQALRPGDRIVLLFGSPRRASREVEVVGTAFSPETVAGTAPGALVQDAGALGLVWMRHDPLAALSGHESSGNRLAVRLAPGADATEVGAELERTLSEARTTARGRGESSLTVLPRALHPSHRVLQRELTLLRATGWAVPAVFLAVGLFLLGVVLARLILAQRRDIAVLETLGYARAQVAAHYLQMAGAVAALSSLLGIALGSLLARQLLASYGESFSLPVPELGATWDATWRDALIASSALFATAALAAVAPLSGVMRSPLVERLRPPAPTERPRRAVPWLEWRWLRLSTAWRLTVRELMLKKWRSASTLVGIAAAVALVVLSGALVESIDQLITEVFVKGQVQDVEAVFTRPLESTAIAELQRLDGVLVVEPQLALATRIRVGTQVHEVEMLGLPVSARLLRLRDRSGAETLVSPHGVILSRTLADAVGARVGDVLEFEMRGTQQQAARLQVHTVLDDLAGGFAYLEIQSLRRAFDQGDVVSGARLRVDLRHEAALRSDLDRLPQVASAVWRREQLHRLRTRLAEGFGSMFPLYVVFGGAVVFAMAYNLSRISFFERRRELAILLLSGFQRREMNRMLVCEFGVLAALGVPLGWILGRLLQRQAALVMSSETLRLPAVASPSSLALSGVAVATAVGLVALSVRREVATLDAVAASRLAD